MPKLVEGFPCCYLRFNPLIKPIYWRSLDNLSVDINRFSSVESFLDLLDDGYHRVLTTPIITSIRCETFAR